MIYDVIIIGAGASGLFCSSSFKLEPRDASPQPFQGLILEKGERPGRKLLMSGSGQCNITHDGTIKDFIKCYGESGRIIRSCLYKYSNLSLMEFLESGGVKTVIREDGKVFPASMDARDVLQLLLRRTVNNGFQIRLGCDAQRIERCESFESRETRLDDPQAFFWKVHTSDGAFPSRKLIIATGGCSYPSTGSDGGMLQVLTRDLGIVITPLKPALSSIQVQDYPYGALSGISFDTTCTTIWRDGKRIARQTGGLLFTHADLSGPAVLNISKYAQPGDILQISYLHPQDRQQILDRLKALSHGAKGSLAGFMASDLGLPLRFCRSLTERYGNSLKRLAAQLSGEEFCISSVSGFEKAMVTSGGIDLAQIDPQTMLVQDHPGIYAIGEALDVDGITGGYNLQFAYSSARTAAEAICCSNQ